MTTYDESPAPTTTLAEVTAVVKFHQNTATTVAAQGHSTLMSPGVTEGRESTYEPHTKDDDPLPPRSEKVAFRVMEVLRPVMEAHGRYADSCATRDWGNCQPDARADVTLPDGTVLLRDVPTSFILFLEKQCATAWRNFIEKLPTLDPRENWEEFDKDRELWRSKPRQEPDQVAVPYGAVLYDATPEHPAQVAEYDRDELIGTWTHVRYSGAVPPETLRDMLERLDELTVAVKLAREKANATPVYEKNVSAPIFAYLLDGHLPQTSRPDIGGESQ